jgi:hypothetical protein
MIAPSTFSLVPYSENHHSAFYLCEFDQSNSFIQAEIVSVCLFGTGLFWSITFSWFIHAVTCVGISSLLKVE